MKLIAVQPYVKVQREVHSIEQVNKELKRELMLYEDRVESKYRKFHIKDVLDMSYRPFGKEGGLLYLHTNEGVFPYSVKTSPDDFMVAFRQIKSK